VTETSVDNSGPRWHRETENTKSAKSWRRYPSSTRPKWIQRFNHSNPPTLPTQQEWSWRLNDILEGRGIKYGAEIEMWVYPVPNPR